MFHIFCQEYLRRLPHRPYCTDDLRAGLKVRPLGMARRYPYIQLNPPGIRWVLVFDVDRPMTGKEITGTDLPDWTWRAVNPENGHCHIAYALRVPVCTSDAARTAPLRYLAAIEAAYRRRLGADPLYAGLIAKNPEAADYWDVFYGDTDGDLSYTLDELASYVRDDLRRAPGAKQSPGEFSGLGRNCCIFGNVRLWSYRAVRDYWERAGEWMEAVYGQCQKVNAGFRTPLYCREVLGIAKSVARWTWGRFSPDGFSEWQRRSVLRRWESESRKAEGVGLLKSGLCPAEVSEACGVSVRSVRRWLREIRQERQSVTASGPWEALGVSRRWYYRLLADGRIDDYKRSRYKALQS